MFSYLNEPILDYQYKKNDLKVIRLNFRPDTRNEIVNEYLLKGFAIYEIDNDNVDDEILFENIARYLNLGQPYTPSLYDKSGLYISGINQLTVSKGNHRAFQTNNAQDLHCDGTLEEIGLIRTSIIHCVKAANKGGETIIFNSVGAFHSLYKDYEKRNILDTLLQGDALKRVSVDLNRQEYIGPVFGVIENKLVSRFSKDNTSYWNESFRNNKKTEYAFNLINNLAVEGSPFFIKFKLKDNQGIILANDRVAHGRTAFKDNDRKLLRGLYKERLY